MPLVYLSASSLLTRIRAAGQLSIVPLLVQSGVSGLEIRHELLSELDADLKRPRNIQRDPNFHLVYSTPSPLFLDGGKFNPDIAQVIDTAGRLQCDIVKFPLGKWEGKPALSGLKKALTEQQEKYPDLILTVENDQTKEGGQITPLRDFLLVCAKEDAPVWMTFDVGNWLFVAENPVDAANTFSHFVRYIHMKHVEKQNGAFVTLPIPHDSWDMYLELLDILPGDAPRCIEFPIAGSDSRSELAEYVKLLGT